MPEPRAIRSSLPSAPQPAPAVVLPDSVPASPSLFGTFQNAVKLDWALAARVGRAPLIASEFRDRFDGMNATSGDARSGMLDQQQRAAIMDYLVALNGREGALDQNPGG